MSVNWSLNETIWLEDSGKWTKGLPMAVLLTKAQQDAYEEQGYLIVRDAFSPERIQSLIVAVNRLMDRALAGECRIRWIDPTERLPGLVYGLFDPDKYDPAYGEWLDGDLAAQVDALIEGGSARYSMFALKGSGGALPYRVSWHRDIGRRGAPDEGEFLHRYHRRLLNFNAPLLPGDRALQIVPGSHLQPTTGEQIRAVAAGDDGDIAGAIRIELEPGDVIYYAIGLWHRELHLSGEKRWTMHGVFWKAGEQVIRNEYGQRASLLTPGHMDRMPPVTRRYIRRYIDSYPSGEPIMLA